MFTLEFKAEIVRHRKAENLSFPECGLRAELSRARMEVIKVIGQLGGYWLTVVVVPDPATN